MSTIRLIALVAGFIGATALCMPNSVWAQQKYQYSHSAPPASSRYVQRNKIDVGDLPGHEIVVVEIQRTFTGDHPVVMGVKVLETWSYGFTDQINGVGRSEGYNTWMLEDGSKIFSEYHGSVYAELSSTGSRRGTYHGAARFVGGTGKFAAIRGTLTDDVEYDTDPKTGYNRPSSRGEYWFSN
jgi:hypothetical protein